MPRLVALDLPGGPGFVTALRAAWDAGDAVTPIDQRLAPAAAQAVLRQLRPHAVVTRSGETRLDGARPTESGDALVVTTSGTTGTPRGVVLTMDAIIASARATSQRLGVDAGRHRWLACLPLSHIGGLSVVTRALLTSTALDVLAGFDAAEVVARRDDATLVSLVPTALQRIGAAGWHTVVLGGSASPGLLASNVVRTYGMTETASGVVYDGDSLAGVEIDIAPEGRQIRLRGPMIARAYRDEHGDRPVCDESGWLHTGDAGHVDDAGILHVDGRLSEMIITGGENVWPAPVEAILATHPGVADVAVAGRPDPQWGERVVALVVPSATGAPPLDSLRELVSATLAPYAAPREMVVVDSLPRTATGKIQRALLHSRVSRLAPDLP